MMTEREIELSFEMARHSDEELLNIVGVNSSQYRQEALDMAIDELVRRGLPYSSAGPRSKYYDYDVKSELKGVGGWLLLLCLRLTIFGPIFLLITLFGAISTSNEYSIAFAQAPGFTVVIIVIVCSIYIVPMLFGIYAGIALWTIRKHAVRLTKIATLIFLGLNLLDILAALGMAALGRQVANLSGAYVALNLPILGGNIVWYAYLNRSERVKNTYVN